MIPFVIAQNAVRIAVIRKMSSVPKTRYHRFPKNQVRPCPGMGIFRLGIDKVPRREYITRKKEVEMKKRIILAVSVLVLLALAGGGVYCYRLPAKVGREEDFDVVMDRYVSNFCDLVEENQFEQATEILREFRATLAGKRISPREHSYYSFYLLIMENFLWYAQKKYEKMKANFPEMERLLKMQEVSGSPPERLLVAKWNFTVEKLRYLQGKNECGKELELVEDFITENGGENQLECSNFSLLYFVLQIFIQLTLRSPYLTEKLLLTLTLLTVNTPWKVTAA